MPVTGCLKYNDAKFIRKKFIEHYCYLKSVCRLEGVKNCLRYGGRQGQIRGLLKIADFPKIGGLPKIVDLSKFAGLPKIAHLLKIAASSSHQVYRMDPRSHAQLILCLV